MVREKDISPIPWTVHTTSKSGIKGEAYIRAADPDDGILGEIVADVMQETDAFTIVDYINHGSKSDGRKLDANTAHKLIKRAYGLLKSYYNEVNVDDEADEWRRDTKIACDAVGLAYKD